MPPKGYKAITMSEALVEWIESQPDYDGSGIPHYIEKRLKQSPRKEAVSTIALTLKDWEKEELFELVFAVLRELSKR